MSDLAEFLLARIDQDESTIRYEAAMPYYGDQKLLAECEAKRRIITEDGLSPPPYNNVVAWSDSFLDVLRLLALPYADHPDYLPEWRP